MGGAVGAALLAAAGARFRGAASARRRALGGLLGDFAGKRVSGAGRFPGARRTNVPMGLIFAVLLVPAGLGFIIWGAGLGLGDVEGLGRLGTSFSGLLPRRADEDEDEYGDAAPVRAIAAEPPGTPHRGARSATGEAALTVVEAPRGPIPGKRQQNRAQSSLDLGDNAICRPGCSSRRHLPRLAARCREP